ncbi:predicted protein [Chaetoceros tenuissimus]|uniref:Uncharacterized protein n=1 Tax=Chaetoceros tenuissimus TaxID=426638 RepID=A0AAD3GZ70_9STRA|nr:predicted protein [Chaetoceros tenuissimus]
MEKKFKTKDISMNEEVLVDDRRDGSEAGTEAGTASDAERDVRDVFMSSDEEEENEMMVEEEERMLPDLAVVEALIGSGSASLKFLENSYLNGVDYCPDCSKKIIGPNSLGYKMNITLAGCMGCDGLYCNICRPVFTVNQCGDSFCGSCIKNTKIQSEYEINSNDVKSFSLIESKW